MNTKITIITGNVATGKSTVVMNWAMQQRQSGATIRGLLNPRINGEKQFINANTNASIRMESVGLPDDIQIGRFRFSKAAFDQANQWTIDGARLPSDAFILDEIGKLELQGKGLHASLMHLMENMEKHARLIFIIRSSLVEEAQRSFGLHNARIMGAEQLTSIKQ